MRLKRRNVSGLKERRRELRNDLTPAEAVLWKCVQRRHILGKKFRRQYSFGRYVIDFFCPECAIAIELDGATHDWDNDYEDERRRFLEKHGIELLRFENRMVHEDIDHVLETIREAIIRRKSINSPP